MSISDHLQNGVLYVVGNGFYGHTPEYSPGLHLTAQADGSYTFKTWLQMEGEPADEIVGTVKGRHITFTRTRPGAWVQKYDGWAFEKYDAHGKVEMAGIFSHNDTKEYGWYGMTGPGLPK